jgi:quercetin dioxygenase-like cupin family protein
MAAATENPWIPMVEGIARRTLVSGTTMLQVVVTLAAGSHLPEHHHPHEQIAHVVRGKLRLIVAGVPHDLEPGESLYLAGNVPHSAEALEETVVIDTFSPPREDFLTQDSAARGT